MKNLLVSLSAVAAVAVVGLSTEPAAAANVKITAIGSHDGEFCRRDRAMIFEDPDLRSIRLSPHVIIACGYDGH